MRLLTYQIINNFRDIDVDISGLASLGWLYPRIVSWTIANFRRQGKNVLEKLAKEGFEYAIEDMIRQSKCSNTKDVLTNKVS